LRGIAILLVWFGHSNLPFLPAPEAGVDIFFALSGYLITGILLRGVDFAAFYKRRARRLLPALAGVLFLAVVLRVAAGGAALAGELRSLVPIALYAGNYVQRPGDLAQMWSLAVEEQFYMLWPLVMFLVVLRLPRWRAWTLGGMLAAVSVPVLLLPHGPDIIDGSVASHIADYQQLLIGCWCALLPTLRVRAWITTLCLGGVLALGYAMQIHPLAYSFALPELVTLLSGVLILTTSARVGVGRLLANPVLVFFGRISYSLYLWHYPIFYYVSRSALYGQLPDWARLLEVLAIALIVSAVSYEFVERRFINSPTLLRWSAGNAWAADHSGDDLHSHELTDTPPEQGTRGEQIERVPLGAPMRPGGTAPRPATPGQ
jgi:peptidoglycan/LPS O-acetylase OafA/YrhL